MHIPRESLRDVFDFQSVGDLAAALKSVSGMMRGVEAGWPAGVENMVPGGMEFRNERELLHSIVDEAEQIGLIAGWSSCLPTDTSVLPYEYFDAFVRMVEERFGCWATSSPPGIGSNRWMWAIELAAEGVWREKHAGNGADDMFPADHFKLKYSIQPDTLGKARRDHRITGEQRGGRWFYSKADVSRLWPDVFLD